MKDIKDYVCMLEQSKRLEALGVEQNSLFYWCKVIINCDMPFVSQEWFISSKENARDKHKNNLYEDIKFISAFTSQELGELIVKQLDKMKYSDVHQYLHSNTFYAHKEFTSADNPESYKQYAIDYPCNINETEAQARAEFLIYLLGKKRGEQ
jgi:hypothetical protein